MWLAFCSGIVYYKGVQNPFARGGASKETGSSDTSCHAAFFRFQAQITQK
jgi:hypothetical protein